ncbi:MAG: UpxY family transcription antiterminator [Bacteroidia bacterium]|nr:UpxY family transcription antiterminator [Bacteroidia bacterium]
MLEKLTWFALYTRPRYEQKVHDELLQMGINAYVPTHKILKQWSDRKKIITEPLFKSYCFVQIKPALYLVPLKANGAVRYVWYDGKPAIVRDKEIEIIRLLCNSELEIDVVDLPLKKGQGVQITNGALTGLNGEYIKNAGKNKILVRIDSISHGLMVTIPQTHVIAC